MQKQQTMAGGETLSFDYTFDIPVEVAAAVCKFTRLYVAIGSNSEVEARNREVRFTPAIRHRQLGHSSPKCARNGSGRLNSIKGRTPSPFIAT